MSYYSASTLDPWTDIVGVPKPIEEDGEKVLEFYRPKNLKDAEFLFFDELNRAHPKVLNAVLEIIQFKSVNGVPLPNLKMVWAAINPPGDEYQVEELDPALVDRFHVYMKMEPKFSLSYMKTKMSEDVAHTLMSWWNDDCDRHQRQIITPRRLEYMGFMIENDLDWKDSIPQGATVPYGELKRKIQIMKNEIDDINIDKDTVLKSPEVFAKRLDENPKEAIKLAQIMSTFNPRQMFECREILERLPKDMLYNVAGKKFQKAKQSIKDLFESNQVDQSAYPKIYEVLKFDKLK